MKRRGHAVRTVHELTMLEIIDLHVKIADEDKEI